MKLAAALLALIIVLQGCVADDGLTGTGQVTLTDRQKTHFERWKTGTTDRDALYFFLIRGGKSYAVYCPETAAICRDAREDNWKQKCDAKYGVDACKLYGVFGDVVWRFTEPADPNWSNGAERFTSSTARKFAVSRSQATVPVDVRKVEINWGGYPGTFSGSLHYRTSLRKYEFNLLIPGETYCDGTAEFTRKTWKVSCRNNVTASGTFRPLGKDKGSIGEGVDSKGNRIEFRVSPPSS